MDFIIITVLTLSIFSYIASAEAIFGSETSDLYLSKSHPFILNKMKNLVVFGDSLTSIDTKFDNMQLQYNYVNRSGGNNWTIFLSQKTNMTLFNFAISGAVIDPDIIPRKNFPNTLINEYRYYLERMTEGRTYYDQWNGDNTLFAFWFGLNDLYSMNRDDYPKKIRNNIFDLMIKVFLTTIEGIHDTGGKNFLFLNVQSLDDLPCNVNFTKPHFDNEVDYFNESFKKQTTEFQKTHEDTNIIIYNVKNELEYIKKNYKQFDFVSDIEFYENHKNDTLNHYLWADHFHPSNKTNEIFTDDIIVLLQSINTQNDKTDGKTDEKANEKTDEKANEKADEQTNEKTDEKTEVKTDEKKDEKKDEKTNKKTDEN